MDREELQKKAKELAAQHKSNVLDQGQIDELLKAIEAVEDDFSSVRDCRKIKIYDFKRPDVFSKRELRDISCISENIARALKKLFASEYDIAVNVHVCSVDQITCEEFVRSMITPAPCCSFEWLEGKGLFEMDPVVFYLCFLGSTSVKKNRDPNDLEKQIFEQFLYTPIMKTVYSEFSKAAQKELAEMTNHKYDPNIQFSLNALSPTEMGVSICFSVKVGKNEGTMNFFFNADCIKSLRDTAFFSDNVNINYVPLVPRKPNTIVEIGRFRLEDNAQFKEKMIFETDNLAGNPLNIYKDGKYVGSGEAVVIDNNSAVRITTKPEEIDEKIDDGFYNTKVIFGSRITDDDFKFDEGIILKLSENIANPIRIEKDGKTIGWGELVVMDESFAVKVTKVI